MPEAIGFAFPARPSLGEDLPGGSDKNIDSGVGGVGEEGGGKGKEVERKSGDVAPDESHSVIYFFPHHFSIYNLYSQHFYAVLSFF